MTPKRRLSWSQSAKAPRWYSIEHHDISSERWYKTGVVPSPHGIVTIYSQRGHTTYRFIWKQREYCVTEGAHHSDRGYATIARRVVREIIAGEYDS